MRKKIKMSTADGDEINLRKVNCQAAIDDSSRTDPKAIWQFFANNADSRARCKMTPTCTVNRKITRLRDVSGDAVEETVVKVSKKRRRTGVRSLLPEESQVRKPCAGQTDILDSGAGDCKKKKKKKRVNKSVKRRRALAAKEVLNITMAGTKNPSGQGQLVELELPTDCTGLGLVSSDESTVTVAVPGAGASAALKVNRCTATDADVWSQGNHSLEPDSSKAFFPIDSYRSLQVMDLISYRTFELCTHTMRPVLSGSKQCRIVACSWDTDTDTEPTSTSTSTSIGRSRRPLTLTAQDRLLVIREHSCVGYSKECGSGSGSGSVKEYEYWLVGSDIGEIHLLSPKPDTDRLHSLTTATAAASSLTSSTVGSQIALREKVKSVSLDFQMLSKGNDGAIPQYQSSANSVTSLGNDHDRNNQPGKGTGIFNGTSSLSPSEIGITYTQLPVIVSESILCGIEMLSKGAGANKKTRKAKAKGLGKEKGGMGINCHPLSQLCPSPSSVDHILLDMDMQSTPTNSTDSQSNAMSLSPCVRESILPGQSSCTEAEAEKSTTECNMSLTKPTDIDPTRPQLSPTSSNREGEDDYSDIPVPVAAAVSFADMFESLLSEKRKLIQ